MGRAFGDRATGDSDAELSTGSTAAVLQCALDGYARTLASLETVLRAIELAPDESTKQSLVDVALRAVALSRSARRRIPKLFEEHVAKGGAYSDEERAAMRRELGAYLDACAADIVEHERGIFALAPPVAPPVAPRRRPATARRSSTPARGPTGKS